MEDDEKKKGKVCNFFHFKKTCDDEKLQETASSSNPISVEEDSATETPDTDQQSLRNRRPRSQTDAEPEPDLKRPRYDSSSSDSTLLDLNSPLNQQKQTLETTASPALTQPLPMPPLPPIEFEFPKLIPPIQIPNLPVLESWLQQEFFPTKTSAPTPSSGEYIPGIGPPVPIGERPPRPPKPPRPPRPPASKPRLELGLPQRAQTSTTGSGSQSSIPNVGIKLGAGVYTLASSAQQQRMQQTPPSGANHLSISPQTAQQMKIYASSLFQSSQGAVSQPNDSITCMRRLEDEVNNLKGTADRLLSELADSKSRILKLEADVRSLKGSNDGLLPELSISLPEAEFGKSSEEQIATDDISCSSDDGQIRPIPAVDAEVASDMRARSGPGSTSGKDDESEGPATIAAGDWLSAANTDRNEATTESDELQDSKAKAKNASTSQDDISCSSDDGQIRPIPAVDAEVSSDMRVRSGPGSISGKDNESEGPATIAAGDGSTAASADRSKATTESDELQDDAKAKNANTSQDDSTQ